MALSSENNNPHTQTTAQGNSTKILFYGCNSAEVDIFLKFEKKFFSFASFESCELSVRDMQCGGMIELHCLKWLKDYGQSCFRTFMKHLELFIFLKVNVLNSYRFMTTVHEVFFQLSQAV